MTSDRSLELPVPPFYDATAAGSWDWRPDAAAVHERALGWRGAHEVAPSSEDELPVRLLLVDPQKDFCLPEGTLYVAGRTGRGAIEDSSRIARFIYRNLGTLTEIVTTLDTHHPYQIFFPAFWVGDDGLPVAPHTEVTTDDVRSGRLLPHPALARPLAEGDYDWLCRQALFYCEELERTARYTLYLWPPHCLLGSGGHALVGVVQEARLFHAFVRTAADRVVVKGEHPLTEHYSVLSPEVTGRHDGGSLLAPDRRLIELLLSSAAVLVAGQAASHCVRYTVEDLLAEMGRRRDPSPELYLLEDCTSAVVVPDPQRPGEALFDFTPQVEEAMVRYREAGVRIVRSTDPVTEWPGFPIQALEAAR